MRVNSGREFEYGKVVTIFGSSFGVAMKRTVEAFIGIIIVLEDNC